MNVSAIVGLVSALCAILGFLIGRYESIRKKGKEEGKSWAAQEKDIDHIRKNTDEIKGTMKNMNEQLMDTVKTVAQHDYAIKELKEDHKDLISRFERCMEGRG